MDWLGAALTETAEQPGADLLSRFQQSIEPEWIEQALQATGTVTLRTRRLPAEQVLWLVLGMALVRDWPIDELVSRLDLALPNPWKSTVAKSSVAQARQRLGPQPLKWLFERCAKQWAHRSAASHDWRGLGVFAMDGTTMRVPDSDENREAFGLASGHRGDSGYPIARIATLLAVRSHILASAAIGPYATSEQALAQGCVSSIADDSITIVDRNFLSAKCLLGIQREGHNRHWLTRAKSSTKWEALAQLGSGDLLVEMTVSKSARSQDAQLPKKYVARAIGYQFPNSKGPQWLLTSLLDAEAYPAKELVELYHERWEIELAYDEIKTHLLEREETIRSRTASGVYQELWGILLAYNLVRLEMQRIAAEAKVPPTRISFMMATRYIRDQWAWCPIASPGAIPSKLRKMRERIARFVLPPRRSKRRFPRAVKLKMSNYPKKHRKPEPHPASREPAASDATGKGSCHF